MTYCIYTTATGKLVSIGTVLADPLPADLTALALSAEEAEGLKSGTMQWDEATRSLVPTPPPAVTAAEFVDEQGFSGNRTTTMLYLKLQLDAAGKSSAKLAAVQAWLDQLIVAGVTAPDERRTAEAWGDSPWSFEQASSEALAVLAQP